MPAPVPRRRGLRCVAPRPGKRRLDRGMPADGLRSLSSSPCGPRPARACRWLASDRTAMRLRWERRRTGAPALGNMHGGVGRRARCDVFAVMASDLLSMFADAFVECAHRHTLCSARGGLPIRLRQPAAQCEWRLALPSQTTNYKRAPARRPLDLRVAHQGSLCAASALSSHRSPAL